MAKSFIAINPNKQVFEFSKTGIERLKDLHQQQRTKGWQYGEKSELETLKAKIISPQEAQDAVKELAELKAKIEREKTKTETKSEKK